MFVAPGIGDPWYWWPLVLVAPGIGGPWYWWPIVSAHGVGNTKVLQLFYNFNEFYFPDTAVYEY